MKISKIKIPEKPPFQENGHWLREYFSRKISTNGVIQMVNEFNAKFLLFATTGNNPWKSLVRFNILDQDAVDILMEGCKYECEIFEGTFYLGVMPIMVISDNIDKYRIGEKHLHEDFYFDFKYHINQYEEYLLELNDVAEAKFGHGYVYGCGPNDGISTKENLIMDLDNGDAIVFKTWEWSNK